ncbi:MAG TPA: neutral/alkaline non-lysosomal ceramidase N-terminal domain-containing protein [Lacipirellulaceae bacterium]|nr:neutral/alkaline non-lysosomal ceramidase N-terminal domain-containing protein [Lacipirellulaceae bacterium]
MPDTGGREIESVTNPALKYKAGGASICITPEDPFWLAGYAVRTTPALGKISDLYASALALEDETGQRFVISSVEMIAVDAELCDRVADAVRQRHGLLRHQLSFTATHTHYAPEFRPDKALFFHIPTDYALKIPAVAERLADSLIEVIDEALSRLEPVQLFTRTASACFAHNRRRRGVKAGKPSTEDTLDQDVPVLDCVDAAGNRVAVVFGYACHCTTIPPEDSRYCGDWVGFAREQLQQTYPGATALFIPGPGADQDPEPRGSLELSRKYGGEIAASVQNALEGPAMEINGAMQIGWENVPLSLQPVTRERIQHMLDSDDPPQHVKAQYLLGQLESGEKLITSYSAPIQVVRFGSELLLIALSGEPVIDWAHKLKREFEQGTRCKVQGDETPTTGRLPPAPCFPSVWVAGYCNDVFDYVPTRRVQAEGGYEAGRANLWNWIPAPFTDDVEDRVTEAVRRVVAQVSR